MKTKTKNLDCVRLMHEGAKRVQDATRSMTQQERLAYWQKAYREMTGQRNGPRRKKGDS